MIFGFEFYADWVETSSQENIRTRRRWTLKTVRR